MFDYFYLVFFISIFNAVYSSKMEDLMLADIESAFMGITNASVKVLTEKIIPEMYNLTSVDQKIVFKIPDMKCDMGFAMITTDRSELMTPIFPNLTQVTLKKRRLHSTVRNTEGSTHHFRNSTSNAHVWSSLGLDGWSGELTNATEILEIAHKDRQHIKLYTNRTTSIADSKVETFMKTSGQYSMDMSDSIYIARVNDPFGLSTKWSYRNQTDGASTIDDDEDKRQKRNVLELYSMLKCATGCEPLLYQGYGCFCGFLGKGKTVDGIDSCCRMHDKCYEDSSCPFHLQYFVPYVWKCYRGKPLCALDHGEYGGPTSCAALLCYCDMKLSICLRKYKCPLEKAVCTTSLSRKLQNLFF